MDESFSDCLRRLRRWQSSFRLGRVLPEPHSNWDSDSGASGNEPSLPGRVRWFVTGAAPGTIEQLRPGRPQRRRWRIETGRKESEDVGRQVSSAGRRQAQNPNQLEMREPDSWTHDYDAEVKEHDHAVDAALSGIASRTSRSSITVESFPFRVGLMEPWNHLNSHARLLCYPLDSQNCTTTTTIDWEVVKFFIADTRMLIEVLS